MASAENGIESVRTNSPLDERYDRLESKAGEPYFVLKAVNHEVIGTSEMYSSAPAREKGIEAVKANGGGGEGRDLSSSAPAPSTRLAPGRVHVRRIGNQHASIPS